MKNVKKITNILILVFSILLLSIGVALLAQSFVYKDKGWAVKLEFNSNMIVLVIVGVVSLIYSILRLINFKDEKKALFISLTVISLLVSFYGLGEFFKNLADGSTYGECQHYLYFGLVSGVILAIVLVNFINLIKTTKEEN